MRFGPRVRRPAGTAADPVECFSGGATATMVGNIGGDIPRRVCDLAEQDAYWLTPEAAPPEGIHDVTPEGMATHGLVTGEPPTVPCPLPDE